MIKHLTCILIGYIFCTTTVFSYSKGIDFQDESWANILKTAQTQNKHIFIDAYADYCLPCKAMEKETFSQVVVGDFFNEHFVSYKMDIEASKNDYLVHIYKIKELPALLFLSPEGILLQKVIGKQELQPLLELGNKTLQNKWTPDEDVKLIPLNKIMSDVATHKIQLGGTEVNWMIQKQVYEAVLQSAKNKDKVSFQNLLTNTSKANLPNRDRFTFNMQTLFYQLIEDWQVYFEVTSAYLSKTENTDPVELNEIAWTYYQHIENTQQLKKALQWIEQSLKIESEYYNNYTYAALLYKTGFLQKANKIAKKTREIAHMRGINDSDIIYLMEKNAKQ